ncbi:unnamed protein product, partial [Didymodactylos carnosus]
INMANKSNNSSPDTSDDEVRYTSADLDQSYADVLDSSSDNDDNNISNGSGLSDESDDVTESNKDDNENLNADSITDVTRVETWSETTLEPNLPYYDGELKLPQNIALALP